MECDDEDDDNKTYAYVILVRPSMGGPDVEMLDVTACLGVEEQRAVNQALRRMGEKPIHDIEAAERLVRVVSTLDLRARFNNAEGPYLIKTQSPLTLEQANLLVRDKEIYEQIKKSGRLPGLVT